MRKWLICAVIFALPLCQVFSMSGNVMASDEINYEKTEGTTKIDDTNEESSGENPLKKFGVGMGSGILSLMYTPVKLGVSMAGGIVGGLAYPLSGMNANVSKTIWKKALGGNYVISDEVLRGEKRLELFIDGGDEK